MTFAGTATERVAPAVDRNAVSDAFTGLALALLILPVVIIASQEAIKAVPNSIRLGAYALGATRWEAIRFHVFPLALPGILTGTILDLSLANGESAPMIMNVSAAFIATEQKRWATVVRSAGPERRLRVSGSGRSTRNGNTTRRVSAWATAGVLVPSTASRARNSSTRRIANSSASPKPDFSASTGRSSSTRRTRRRISPPTTPSPAPGCSPAAG